MFGDLVPRSFLEGLFDDVVPSPRREARWWPAVEGHVKDGTLVVRADLPGVDPQQVEVSLDGTELRISGERKFEEHKDAKGTRYSEVRYGRFVRTFTVPEGTDPEKITARYTNGVLEVTAPLPRAQSPRKVPVEVGTTPPPTATDKKAA